MSENKPPRILGITLARGGSKSVPRKNIIPIHGVPLIAYTILEAKRSQFITRLLVSTDDPEIQEVAISYGAEAPFLRPAHLATDTTSSAQAMQHAVAWAEADEGVKYDYVIELMCTNPMKTVEDIDGILVKLMTTGADSVIAVHRLEDHHPLRIKKIVDDRIVDFVLPEPPAAMRQDLKPDAYIRSGAIYALRRDHLMVEGMRFGGANSRPWILPAEKAVNIDSMVDLQIAEVLLAQNPRPYIKTVRQHGKPVDLEKLKKPVLQDLRGHLEKTRNMAAYLSEHETPEHQRGCSICGCAEAHERVKIHGFTYVTCTDCGHIYCTFHYTGDAIRRYYEKNNYYSSVTYANRDTCYYRRDHVARPKVEFAEKYLGSARGLWLDVGCGIGDMVSVVQERGWEGVGLELSETSVKFAKDVFGINLEQQTLEDYVRTHPDVLGTVQVVSLIGVLEHLVDPMGLLALAYKVLAPGGAVMIQVPNGNSLASMVQEVYPGNVFRHMSPIEHLMVFSETSLKRSLEITGFHPDAWWFHGQDIYELLTNLVMSNDLVKDSALFQTLMANMNELQLVIDKKELSDRIICIARK